MKQLKIDELSRSVTAPMSESINLLNEVALDFPDAISFAAGRPYEGDFDLDLIHHYLDTYYAHSVDRQGGDEAAARREILQYGRTKGIINDLVAENLRVDEGISVDPGSIVVTVGCQEALTTTLMTLRREESDAVLAVAPCYVGLYGAAELAGIKVLEVGSGRHGVDFDELATTVREARAAGVRPKALYVIPDFSNPSGIRMSRADRDSLMRLARELEILIIEDNPYGIFDDGETLPTLKSIDRHQQVIYLGTYAKTGIPGARVGFVVADQELALPEGRRGLLADQISKIKGMVTVNTSPIAQAIIGGKLLTDGFDLRRSNRAVVDVYRRNRKHLLGCLAERFPSQGSSGVSWNEPTGGLFCLVTLPFPAGDDLLRVSAEEFGVLWTPLHHFYADGRPRREIRLSFSSLTEHQISEGIARLAAFVADQNQP